MKRPATAPKRRRRLIPVEQNITTSGGYCVPESRERKRGLRELRQARALALPNARRGEFEWERVLEHIDAAIEALR